MVSKSETKEFRYEKDGHIEYLYGVEFRHALLCPLLDEEIKRNKQKPIKPCACVMIVDRDSK